MSQNLILIGFMGTGKTSIGKRLARELRYEFADSDAEIERITDLTIPQLFKKHGEIRFRSEEEAALKRILKKSKQVIATGGGAVLKDSNIALLKEHGPIFCLTASPQVIEERVKRRNNRPLLKKGNSTLKERIVLLLAERENAYSCADYVINTDEGSMEEIAKKIADIYRKHVKGR